MCRLCAGIFLVTLILLLSAPRPVQAAESYDNCTGFITSIPTTISTQGTWCLKSDLATAITSGSAISINTNNVTIDCNNFKLGGLAGGLSSSAYGIHAMARFNATVRHCNIRGFWYGIFLQDSSGGGHAIEDNRFDGNTYIAILVTGDGSVVRGNRIFDTGGSTLLGDAFGIFVGDSTDVLDNTIASVVATAGSNGSAYGIYTTGDTDGTISGNRIRGIVQAGSGLASGIQLVGDVRVILRDNDLLGSGNFGLHCGATASNAMGNVVSGFTTGISTCYDGGNLVRP